MKTQESADNDDFSSSEEIFSNADYTKSDRLHDFELVGKNEITVDDYNERELKDLEDIDAARDKYEKLMKTKIPAINEDYEIDENEEEKQKKACKRDYGQELFELVEEKSSSEGEEEDSYEDSSDEDDEEKDSSDEWDSKSSEEEDVKHEPELSSFEEIIIDLFNY